MAESNITLNSGSGGSNVATMTDGSGYHHQKVVVGFDGGTSPTPVDSSNPLPVDGSNVTQPISHAALTELAAAINASSQLDVNIAASNATLTVASHAVTNAGTFAVQVDGSALTSLQLLDDVVFADDAAFTLTSSKAVAVGAIRDDSLSTLSAAEGDIVPLRVSSTGALHVTGAAGTTQYAEDAVHASGDSGVVCLAVRRDTAAVGSGTDGDYSTLNVNSTGALRVTIDSISGSQTDDAAFTAASGTVSVIGGIVTADSVDSGDAGAIAMTTARAMHVAVQSIAAGDNNIGNVDVVTLPALAAGTNNIGDVDVLSIAAGTNTIGNVGLVGRTSGGLTIFRSIDLDESEEEVKGSAGQVYAMWVTNTATSTRFVKFYNATAANVTVGTTTPVITIGIPGNSSDDISGNFGPGGIGVAFDTAITVAATTGVADNDTGAPGANEVIVNIFYA